MPRPTVGQVTEREIEVNICATCGYTIDSDLCSYECSEDCDPLEDRPKYLIARYKRVDTFMGDEIVLKST